MRSTILSIGLLITSIPLFSQTSFDSYFPVAKQGRSPVREQSFALACGVKRSDAAILYGVSAEGEGWKWQRKSSLGHGTRDAQTDFYGTAVAWMIAGKPRFVNVWMLIMDTGNTNNEMFCLDEQGHVTAQESLNCYDPVDGKGTGWRYLQQIKFSPTGKKMIVHGRFVDEAGNSIVTPKLGAEDMQDARISLEPTLAHDVVAQISH